MTDIEAHDLLIRLELKMTQMCVNQKTLGKELIEIREELSKRQCLLHQNQIASIEKNFDPMVCSRNTEKIATVEKLTWAALLTGVGLIVKSFWSAVTT